jgi:hypothetical protein
VQRLVLIGDIVNSRKEKDRGLLQETIEKTLQNLNIRFKEHILSPYTLTIGDEFQAVFNTPTNIFSQVIHFLKAIYPIKCRFAFAYGAIVTRERIDSSIGMDGPAWWAARNLIEAPESRRHSLGFVSAKNESNLRFENLIVRHIFNAEIRHFSPVRLEILAKLLEGVAKADIIGQRSAPKQSSYALMRKIGSDDLVPILKEIEKRIELEMKNDNLSLLG